MKTIKPKNNEEFKFAALYCFNIINNPEKKKQSLLRVCKDNKIQGTILLAKEGINGTISGSHESIDKTIQYLRNWQEIDNIEVKYSYSSQNGFYRMKVKVKQEIVTMGKPSINPSNARGTYVEPKNWNKLISDENVVVIDTRNTYETGVGKFTGSIDPKTKNFREFPLWADQFAINKLNKNKKIAMYCTGGIRCEKASSYLKEKGFKNVFHLKGGILKYLETVPINKSRWEGECFVFDQRVTVNHNLEKGDFSQCYGCKMPLSKKEVENKKYIKGVTCKYCFDNLSNDQKKRFSQRQKQIELSLSRGEAHIGQTKKIK
tara:strand:+ start:548 stop:1501 length:954 start_codon:yes stop_codon:yes gene_type:complete